jgi:hypothetical protein
LDQNDFDELSFKEDNRPFIDDIKSGKKTSLKQKLDYLSLRLLEKDQLCIKEQQLLQ